MSRINIYSSEYADATFIEEYKMAHMTWKRLVIPSEEYRRAFTMLLDFGDSKRIVSFLSDGRNTGPVDPSDRKWFQDVAIPRAEKLGLKHSAVIIKNDPFRKFYLNSIIKVVNLTSSYNIKVFTDYDEGFKWLISYGDYND